MTSYEKLKLRCEVAEKALALRAEDTPANQVTLVKALNAYEAATNDVGSAIAKALIVRVNPNLLANDSLRKSVADTDPGTDIHGITERNRLRREGRTTRKKVTLNMDGVSEALKNPPPINIQRSGKDAA